MSYWSGATISRRQALRGAGRAGAGVAALSLLACGGSDDEKPSTQTSASGDVLDATRGIPGGTLRTGNVNYPASLLLAERNDSYAQRIAGLTNSGLLVHKYGRIGIPGTSVDVEIDLAQALPEQPDELTYTFKLRQSKFQNGRTVTAEDVRYSFDRYANLPASAHKAAWFWFDRVDTPDPQTVVVKTKSPYADAIKSMAAHKDAFILAKEHEEGPDAATRIMGSGAYIFVDTTAPLITRLRKNPDYFDKPYPYFDSVELLSYTDNQKQISDFITRQLHVTSWVSENPRDDIIKSRPEARLVSYDVPGYCVFMRTDRPPFNDKRVRQALSMSINRKTLREAIYKGSGQDDQALSAANKGWGFRPPKDLGTAAKYWNLDIAAAKQLLTAAGQTQPIDTQMSHWDAATRQELVDSAILAQSQWKEVGIANIKDNTQLFAQYTATTSMGNYEGMGMGPLGLQSPNLGLIIRNQFWSPPEGVKAPTPNNGIVNNPQLSALVDKQLTQLKAEDRAATFRQIEELIAEEQYRVVFSTFTHNYFHDNTVKNAAMPFYGIGSSIHFVKYWWFDKA